MTTLFRTFQCGIKPGLIQPLGVVMLAMIALTMAHDARSASENEKAKAALPPPPPIVVRVTGYAAYTPKKEDVVDPKRLHAIRASKLDAYRNLAERVYGIALQGQSSVSQFELKNDVFTAAIDTVIRGARVVSISENKKTGIETVLELLLPGHFQDCLNKANHFRYEQDCLRPLTPITASESLDSNGPRTSTRAQMDTVYYLN